MRGGNYPGKKNQERHLSSSLVLEEKVSPRMNSHSLMRSAGKKALDFHVESTLKRRNKVWVRTVKNGKGKKNK